MYLSVVDRRDQKALERLRAERKAKIDELKERTNYYTTQQLIQVLIAPIEFLINSLSGSDIFPLQAFNSHALLTSPFLYTEIRS